MSGGTETIALAALVAFNALGVAIAIWRTFVIQKQVHSICWGLWPERNGVPPSRADWEQWDRDNEISSDDRDRDHD